MNEFIKKMSLFNTLTFYTFTILMIFFLLSYIPFFPLDYLIPSDKLGEVGFIKWISLHSDDIMRYSCVYFMLFFVILILLFINKYYGKQFKILTDVMFAIGSHFILLMELLHKLKITRYGIEATFAYYNQLIARNGFFILSFAGYGLTLSLMFLVIIGYFYRSGK